MTSAVDHAPKSELGIVIISLAVLGLGVATVIALGVIAGYPMLDGIATTDRAPERLRDNAQLEISQKLSAQSVYSEAWGLTLRAGASSGAATVQAGLAERENMKEAAHWWLALDALAQTNTPLAQAHIRAAEEARPSGASPPHSAYLEKLRREFARLRGWASIPASRARDLAEWNESVGREILAD